MPKYDYACKSCGDEFEVSQAFTDDPLTVCSKCGGDLRKLFGSIGITFKGTGFYRNDSKAATKSSRPSSPGGEAPATSPMPVSEAGSKDASSSSSGVVPAPTPAPAPVSKSESS